MPFLSHTSGFSAGFSCVISFRYDALSSFIPKSLVKLFLSLSVRLSNTNVTNFEASNILIILWWRPVSSPIQTSGDTCSAFYDTNNALTIPINCRRDRLSRNAQRTFPKTKARIISSYAHWSSTRCGFRFKNLVIVPVYWEWAINGGRDGSFICIFDHFVSFDITPCFTSTNSFLLSFVACVSMFLSAWSFSPHLGIFLSTKHAALLLFHTWAITIRSCKLKVFVNGMYCSSPSSLSAHQFNISVVYKYQIQWAKVLTGHITSKHLKATYPYERKLMMQLVLK